MNKIILIISAIISLSFISNKYKIEDFLSNIAGGNLKKWNIVNNYPKNATIPSCNYPNNHSIDNTWTFRTDYSFSFDPGQIRRSDTSQVNTSCRDPYPLAGNWELIENNSKLKLNVLLSDNTQVSEISILVFEIEKVTEDTLILIERYDDASTDKFIFTTK